MKIRKIAKTYVVNMIDTPGHVDFPVKSLRLRDCVMELWYWWTL